MFTKRTSATERFWRQVGSKEEGCCWLWTGALSNGYGSLGAGGRTNIKHRAHRFSYEIHKGPITAGMLVCHSCDVRNCVNPAHLWLGTNADNIKDREAKGRGNSRGPSGERQGSAKLTKDKVIAIYNDPRTRTAIAIDYNLDRSTVSGIKLGRAWKHVIIPLRNSYLATINPQEVK